MFLQNVDNGRTTGTRTCDDLAYGRGPETRECGPITVAPERGHRYRVVMSWRFQRQGQLSTGEAKGSEFGY